METQNIEEVKRVILTQLPRLMETEPEIRDFILRVTREQYAGKQETESRFDRIMDELRRDREADMRKWEAQEQRWAAWDKKWEEERQTQEKKWEAQESKWEAQEKKWEDNQKVINEMLAEIRLQNQKYDSTIGCLLYTSPSPRD